MDSAAAAITDSLGVQQAARPYPLLAKQLYVRFEFVSLANYPVFSEEKLHI